MNGEYLSDIDVGKLLGRNAHENRDEMITLGLSIENDLERINPMCRPFQLRDKVHGDLLMCPHGNG